MKKKLWKSTFVVAVAMTTSFASVFTYANGPSALFSEVDLLMVENLFAYADNSEPEPVYGPALKISHHNVTLVDHANTLDAWNDLHEIYKEDPDVADAKYREVCAIENCMDKLDVPTEYHKYVTFKEPNNYYRGERLEYELNGEYTSCQSFGNTTLPSSGKPSAKIYLTEEEYKAER